MRPGGDAPSAGANIVSADEGSSDNFVGFTPLVLDYRGDGRSWILISASVDGGNRGLPHVALLEPRPDESGYTLDRHPLADEGTGPYEGAGTADLDGDGQLDLFLNPRADERWLIDEARPLSFRLMRNRNATSPLLGIRLLGAQANSEGVGAIITALIDGKTVKRQITNGGSSQGWSEPLVSFGLGQATCAEQITVRWPAPSNRTEIFTDVCPPDARGGTVLLREGEGSAR